MWVHHLPSLWKENAKARMIRSRQFQRSGTRNYNLTLLHTTCNLKIITALWKTGFSWFYRVKDQKSHQRKTCWYFINVDSVVIGASGFGQGFPEGIPEGFPEITTSKIGEWYLNMIFPSLLPQSVANSVFIVSTIVGLTGRIPFHS